MFVTMCGHWAMAFFVILDIFLAVYVSRLSTIRTLFFPSSTQRLVIRHIQQFSPRHIQRFSFDVSVVPNGEDFHFCSNVSLLPIVLTTVDGQYLRGTSIFVSSALIPRKLNSTQYNLILGLIEILDIVLKDANIKYLFGYGNFIGAHLMHDILPWEDGIDIHVPISFQESFARQVERWNNDSSVFSPLQISMGLIPDNVKLVFENNPQEKTKKLYMKNTGSRTPSFWNWPFCDIHFDNVLQRHSPPVYKPYGPLILPFPPNFNFYMSDIYGDPKRDACENEGWDRVKGEKRTNTKTVSCRELQNYYAFVNRTRITSECTREVLALNSQVFQVAYVGGHD